MPNQWTAVPAKRSRSSDANFRAMLVLGILVIAAIMGVVSLIAWITTDTSAPLPPYQPPVGTAVAKSAASAFISGTMPVVPATPNDDDIYVAPTGTIATDGLWEVGVYRDVYYLENESTVPIEIHSFLYVDGENTYLVTVPVTLQEGELPTVAATPFLEPYVGATEGIMLDLIGEDVVASDAVKEKINRWATAYYSDNQGELADVSGDAAGAYYGLGGWKVEDLRIVMYRQPNASKNRFVARLSINVVREDGVQMNQFMDIVVDESGSVPTIPAWGPIGLIWELF